MQSQIFVEPSLVEKIYRLPPEKISEVVDFVEFLAQRQRLQQLGREEQQLTQSVMQLSQGAFSTVWDNPADAVYDTL